MKLLIDRAANSDSDQERASYLRVIEDLQLLLNRIGTPEEPGSLLATIQKDAVYMALTVESKLCILKQANAIHELSMLVGRLVETISGDEKKGKSASLRLVAWFIRKWRW